MKKVLFLLGLLSLVACNGDEPVTLGDGGPIAHKTCEVLVTEKPWTLDELELLQDYLNSKGYKLVESSENPIFKLKIKGSERTTRPGHGFGETTDRTYFFDVYYNGIRVMQGGSTVYALNYYEYLDTVEKFVKQLNSEREVIVPECNLE